MQRDQLADEQSVKGRRRLPSGPEEAVFGPYQAHLDARAGQIELLLEVACMLVRVGDDEVGAAEGEAIDLPQHACCGRIGRIAAAIADERVVKRDERVEHERPSSGDPACRRHVEMPWVADDHHVERGRAPKDESRLSSRDAEERADAERPLVSAPFPDRGVSLDHLHSRGAQA